MVTINIATDFSATPGARYRIEGPFSGEQFRQEFLEKHFETKEADYKVRIILDGVAGFPTSFLEEAFGGLARKFGKARVKERLLFDSSEDPFLSQEINGYIDDCEGDAK